MWNVSFNRSYRWLLVYFIVKRLPYSWLCAILLQVYFLLTSAKRQPLPVVVSLMLLPVTDFAQTMLQFSITVRCALREIPLVDRLKNDQQRDMVKQLWGSAFAFGFGTVLVILLIIPAPYVLWFHVAAANADLAAHQPLKLTKSIGAEE